MSFDASQVLALRDSILSQNEAIRRASGRDSIAGQLGTPAVPQEGFTSALENALQQVNSSMKQSQAISEAYERGEVTDIAAVMLTRQQASIGFEATLQVRNRLLSAYKDIMGMPV
ncbi:MAG: flagellar hook-basal body complex protein FliE [Sphingopyxis sp.]|nr:flagellar hook-basal body complex protein FliE [Sphingopyxis sp.]